MIYGVILLINFAHGEIYMLGAFFAVTFISLLGLPFYVAFFLSMACCSICGMLLDIVAYRPLRRSPRLAALITAIGMSIFLQNLAMVIWGSRPKPFPHGTLPAYFEKVAVTFGGVNLSWFHLFIFGLTTEEVGATLAEGYHPRRIYESDERIRRVVDAIAKGAFSPEEPGRFGAITDALLALLRGGGGAAAACGAGGGAGVLRHVCRRRRRRGEPHGRHRRLALRAAAGETAGACRRVLFNREALGRAPPATQVGRTTTPLAWQAPNLSRRRRERSPGLGFGEAGATQ